MRKVSVLLGIMLLLVLLAASHWAEAAGIAVQATATAPAEAAQEAGSPPRIQLLLGEARAIVNGNGLDLPAPVNEQLGVTLVPLRFLAETLGIKVDWVGDNNQVMLSGKDQRVELTLGSSRAVVNGQEEEFGRVAELYQNAITMVPLRFLAELCGLQVNFDPGNRQVELVMTPPPPPNNQPVAVIGLDQTVFYLGTPVTFSDQSYDSDGDRLVERVWANLPPYPAPGKYELSLQVRDEHGVWSEPSSRTVTVAPWPNRPPVAQFSINRITVDQGETIVYRDESYDPDGDALVEYRWQGRQEAFFEPGRHPVRLQVKDQKGQWSDPYEVDIEVTTRVRASQLDYSLANPRPGEKLALDLQPAQGASLRPDAIKNGGPTLLLSNSPETVTTSGLLYRDNAGGRVRLFFHHQNGSNLPLVFPVLATNPGSLPVDVMVTRWGAAGPLEDVVGAGQAATLRYLDSRGERKITIEPGQSAVINVDLYRPVMPNQVISGIYDLEVTGSGQLEFSFLAIPAGVNPVASLASLPVLPADQHLRGTFPHADRHLAVAPGRELARLTLVDGQEDLWIVGRDAMTGKTVTNKGNYGMLYHLDLQVSSEQALLTGARGGLFSGAYRINGATHALPAAGWLDYGELALNSLLQPSQPTALEIMPPAASYLPIWLWFWSLPDQLAR